MQQMKDGMKRLVLAAERGDAAAQFNLGIMYAGRLDDNGNPVAPDRALAMTWLRKAAEQGLPRAQSRLAVLLAEQPSTTESDVSACAWFILALTGLSGIHHEEAAAGYQRAALRLTASELAEAARRARAWKPAEHAVEAGAEMRTRGRNHSDARRPETRDRDPGQ